MTELRLLVAPWSRPLKRPIVVGSTTVTSRSGLLLALGDRRGRFGLGDAAPLPGLSHESLDDVTAQVRARGRAVVARLAAWPIDDLAALPAPQLAPFLEDLLPALGQALEAAILDLAAVSPSALRTAHLLDDDGSEDDRVAGVVKVKVGRRELVWECERVAHLRERGLRVRLDGNRRLDVQATHALADAAGDALEFFEEPTPPSLLSGVHVPLALDETLDETLAALPDTASDATLHAALRALPPSRVWVVKPTILGPARTARLLASAPGLGTSIVLSSAYDSSVGRRGLVRLGGKRGLWGSVHGLGTGALLAGDLTSTMATIIQQDGDVIGVGDALSPASFDDVTWEEIP